MKTIRLLHLLRHVPGAGHPAVRRWLQNARRQARTVPPTLLYDRHTFKRWAEHDPRGWTAHGRFYGAGGQFLGDRFSLSGEDLARGVAVLGSSALPSILFPTIADRMRCHHSLVVTDLSDLVQYYVQRFAAVTGHLVLTHNMSDPAASCALNPCRWIEGTDEARALGGILLSGAHSSALAGNRQGMRAAGDLLAACILHYPSLVQAWEAQHNMRQLLGDLMRSQAPGVADLMLPFRRLAAQDMELARTVALTTMKVGLAPWANAAIRDIGGHDDLDLAVQLRGVPTVIVFRCPGRWSETYGPYLGAILYALAARLARLGAGPQEADTPITVGSLPVGLILTGWPELGRLDALFWIARGHVPILATARSITQFNPFYPARQDAERLLAGMATHIISAGCDQATAEVVSRLGRGLILPGDVTGLAADHAIVLTASGEGAEPARFAFHGVPTSFFKRKDWEMKSHRIQPIHIAYRQPPVPSPPAPASSQPESPPVQTVRTEQPPEPPVDKPKPRHPKNDAIERLLADAPETGRQQTKDPWADEK